MRIATKAQLGLFLLALACLIGVVTVLIVNSMVTNQIIYEAQERVKEHLSSARCKILFIWSALRRNDRKQIRPCEGKTHRALLPFLHVRHVVRLCDLFCPFLENLKKMIGFRFLTLLILLF